MKEKAKKALINNILEFKKDHEAKYRSVYAWAYLSGFAPDLTVREGYQIMDELYNEGLIAL